MFLGRGATQFALNPTKAKQDPQALEDVRCSLIGNSFHAGVFGMVLSVLFERKKLLERKPTTQEMVSRQGLHPGEVYSEGRICHLRRPATFHRLDGQRRGHCAQSFAEAKSAQSEHNSPDLERITLNALLRSADYRGSDVRMDSGALMKPNQWPRRSIDPAKWTWYPILSHPYKDQEHINLLEVRAAHLMLRWRSRTQARIGSRFFHLLDSQVALAVLCKGRSSSHQMNRLLRRIGALTAASGFFPSWATLCPCGILRIEVRAGTRASRDRDARSPDARGRRKRRKSKWGQVS